MFKQKQQFEEIHIWDFPNNMYVRLPDDYRKIFFQLAILDFGTLKNLKKILKKNKLSTNVSKWKFGRDKNLEQLINLESLIFLRSYVKKRSDKIRDKYLLLKSNINNEKRIIKDKILISILKDTVYLLGGHEKFSKIFDINIRTLVSYLYYKKIKSIPMELIKNILRYLEQKILCYSFSLEEIENTIISYKAYHGKEIMTIFQDKRKLPILVTPEFESIIYHFMGDGHVAKIGSSEYTQLKEIAKNNFLQKLYNVFGYFDISQKGFENGRIYVSKTIIKIICDYYKLRTDDFKWERAALPNICFQRDNAFKLAGLIAFIVDEAYVGKSVIAVHSSNRMLLSQIKELALDLGVICSDIMLKKGRKTTKDSFRFHILKEGVKKLKILSDELKMKYPTCNLAQKEEKILKIVN